MVWSVSTPTLDHPQQPLHLRRVLLLTSPAPSLALLRSTGYPQCWAVDILPGQPRGELFVWRGDGTDWLLQNFTDDWCRQHAIPPTVPLQAHTAPIGLVFYDGKGKYGFPPEMYNQVLIAQHGSWDSDTPRGYKVSRVEWTEAGDGKVTAQTYDFFGHPHPHTPTPQHA